MRFKRGGDGILVLETRTRLGVKYYIIANPATKTWQSYVLQGAAYVEQEFATVEVHERCSIAIDLHKAMAAVKD